MSWRTRACSVVSTAKRPQEFMHLLNSAASARTLVEPCFRARQVSRSALCCREVYTATSNSRSQSNLAVKAASSTGRSASAAADRSASRAPKRASLVFMKSCHATSNSPVREWCTTIQLVLSERLKGTFSVLVSSVTCAIHCRSRAALGVSCWTDFVAAA